jgi:hypothetical protein
MEFNFKNIKVSLSILFQNISFQSTGYQIGRLEHCDVTDDEDLRQYQLCADNLSLVIRFYSKQDLPFSELSKNIFSGIPYSDLLIRLRDSKRVTHLEVGESGIRTTLNGYILVDLEYSELIKMYEDHVAYVIGFYGSSNNGYMFSPLIGHDASDPKTWHRFSTNYHKIKLYSNELGGRYN